MGDPVRSGQARRSSGVMGRVGKDVEMNKVKGIHDRQEHPENIQEGGHSMRNGKMKPVGTHNILKTFVVKGRSRMSEVYCDTPLFSHQHSWRSTLPEKNTES